MGKDAKAQAKHAQKNLKQMLPGFGGKEKKNISGYKMEMMNTTLEKPQ